MLSQEREMASLPSHVRTLLRELEATSSPLRTLQRFSAFRALDPTLQSVFSALGLEEDTGICDSPERVIELVLAQYRASPLSVTPLKEISNFLLEGGQGFTTPVAGKEVCLTPRPRRTQHSVSTKASQILSPSSLTSGSDEESDFDPVKSSRGLKSLTIQIKQLMAKRRTLSYQEAATLLAKDARGSERTREEKNIKRRVYDAINVLIAAGVLDRDEKGVCMRKGDGDGEASASEEEICARRNAVYQKKVQLNEILSRFLAVQSLLHRNAQNKDSADRLHFPFLVLGADDSDSNSMHLISNSPCTSLLVKFRNPVAILGDLEVLLHLNLHHVSLQMLTHLLPHRDLFTHVDWSLLRS